jgi:hypothetical protein
VSFSCGSLQEFRPLSLLALALRLELAAAAAAAMLLSEWEERRVVNPKASLLPPDSLLSGPEWEGRLGSFFYLAVKGSFIEV